MNALRRLAGACLVGCLFGCPQICHGQVERLRVPAGETRDVLCAQPEDVPMTDQTRCMLAAENGDAVLYVPEPDLWVGLAAGSILVGLLSWRIAR